MAKEHFRRYLRGFRHFLYFQILPDLYRSKRRPGTLLRLDENWPKNMHHTTETRNLSLIFLDLVNMDDLDLNQGHQNLKRTLKSTQTRSMPFHQLCFSMISPLCPTKPAATESKNPAFAWPVALSVSGWQVVSAIATAVPRIRYAGLWARVPSPLAARVPRRRVLVTLWLVHHDNGVCARCGLSSQIGR